MSGSSKKKQFVHQCLSMLDAGSFAVSLHPSVLSQHQIHPEEIGWNVRILLGATWEHKGCLERLHLGGSELILKLLEVGKYGWCSAFSGSNLRLICYTSVAPSINEASPNLKGTEICCGNLVCSCRMELPQAPVCFQACPASFSKKAAKRLIRNRKQREDNLPLNNFLSGSKHEFWVGW